MWRIVFLLLVAACSPVDQESLRTVAAIEVPLRSGADRADLLAMLRRSAAAAGLHVDDDSAQWREFDREANMMAPRDRLTFDVGVWRGANDDEPEIIADDRFHPGSVWISFLRGSLPDRSIRFRELLIAEMRAHWPDARAIPVTPDGGLPLVEDLVLTDRGYRI